MNIYLCSTVRHLLFSLLKALTESEKNSLVIMIADQQNIDVTKFNCGRLPPNVKVIFLRREELRKSIYSNIQGQTIKQFANFNIKTSPFTRRKISNLLLNKTLNLSLSHSDIAQSQLFLFNDRNKISRLFRLAFEQYSLIEEGLANYSGIKLKPLEKLNALISKSKRKMRYFGDDIRCKKIYLLNIKKAPQPLSHKVRPITFLQNKEAIQQCNTFFNVRPDNHKQCILATQPLEDSGVDLAIYKKIISACQEHNMSVMIKPHPREDIQRYLISFPEIPLIDSKLPLELIAVNKPVKCSILSIYSTAGMGFETYCRRINIIKDNEIEQVQNYLDSWKVNLNLVDDRINNLILELQEEIE